VQIKIIRPGETDTLTFNLVREEVIVKNLVFADFYPENSNNVYLKLSTFSRSAGDEVRSALRQLKEKKEIKSIVLDLRGNPGGLLDVAVDICDKFLKKDLLIVSTRGKVLNSEKKYFAVEEPLVGTEKLIVLVNGNSASASEIVAGAMQDHDRGVILGTQSFGKGLVQTITPLSFNTSLKITTAKYYTPSGRCIQRIDYSKDNQVIPERDSIKKDEFATDNKRVVYSAGGITPDTTVTNTIESDLLKDFLAKGSLFNFADKYYYQNVNADFNKLNDDKIISDFKKYLTESKYNYESDVEKKINEIIKHINENHNSKNLNQTLEKLNIEIKDLFEDDFAASKIEILKALKIELAQRFLGNQGAIKERLQFDKQFNTALALFKDNENYSRLLSSGKSN
ncbi:MAG: S41 family peptidase, partial [Ignavibacteriota bacterium]